MCRCRCVFRVAGENPSAGSTNASARVPADSDRTLLMQQAFPSDAQCSAPSCPPSHTVQASVQPSAVLAEPSSLTCSSEAGAFSGSLGSRHRAGPGQQAKHTFSRFAWLTNSPEVRSCVLAGRMHHLSVPAVFVTAVEVKCADVVLVLQMKQSVSACCPFLMPCVAHCLMHRHGLHCQIIGINSVPCKELHDGQCTKPASGKVASQCSLVLQPHLIAELAQGHHCAQDVCMLLTGICRQAMVRQQHAGCFDGICKQAMVTQQHAGCFNGICRQAMMT